MNDNVVIVYNGEQVSVPKEVADFLEQDRKRQQAQDKQDARHLSKVSLKRCCPVRIASSVPWRMQCSGTSGLKICGESLRNWTCKGQNLLSLRYSGELTMDELGQIYGISKMAVSKRLKKLHEKLKLCLMTGLPSFFENFLVFRFTNAR